MLFKENEVTFYWLQNYKCIVHALSPLFTNMLIWQNCTEKTLFKVGFDNSCSSLHNIYLEGAAVHINLTWTYFKWIFRNWNSTRVTKGSIIREWSDRVSRVVPCTLYNIQYTCWGLYLLLSLSGVWWEQRVWHWDEWHRGHGLSSGVTYTITVPRQHKLR